MAFVQALNLVKQLEGGKVDNPRDPGGRTNQGITQALYSQHYSGDVFNATPEQIANIYNSLWRGLQVHDSETDTSRPLFDLLPEPLDSFAFQFYINTPRGFIRSFQISLDCYPDGHIGKQTLHSLSRAPKEALLGKLIACQKMYYFCHHPDDEFTDGLLNRVDRAKSLLNL